MRFAQASKQYWLKGLIKLVFSNGFKNVRNVTISQVKQNVYECME